MTMEIKFPLGLLDEVFALLYGYTPLTPIFIQWLNLLPCMCLSWLHRSHFHECPKISYTDKFSKTKKPVQDSVSVD